jgi:hypothetical protein
MRVLFLRSMAGCTPMPIAPVELEGKLDAFILCVSIHPMPIFGDELGVVVEGVSNAYTAIIKEVT